MKIKTKNGNNEIPLCNHNVIIYNVIIILKYAHSYIKIIKITGRFLNCSSKHYFLVVYQNHNRIILKFFFNFNKI